MTGRLNIFAEGKYLKQVVVVTVKFWLYEIYLYFDVPYFDIGRKLRARISKPMAVFTLHISKNDVAVAHLLNCL